MKNFRLSHRSFYIAYVILWLLLESIYLFRLNYSGIFRGWDNFRFQSKIIEELTIQNFVFGSGGLILSLLLMPKKQRVNYFILTYVIGLAIAHSVFLLDMFVSPFRGGNFSALRYHAVSILAYNVWFLFGVVVASGWILIEIIKYLVELVNRERDDQ
jgi:hypothetical protein